MPDSADLSTEGPTMREAQPLSMNTGLSIALVAVLIGASVVYGRQSQRLDAIEAQGRDNIVETKALRSEIASLRELLISRSMLQQPYQSREKP